MSCRTILATATSAAGLIAAAPADAVTTNLGITCVASRAITDNRLPPNHAAERITFAGRVDTKTSTYTFTTATGTTIVPVGTIRMVAFDNDGPTARAMWRGKDGLNRFFGMHFDMKTAAIRVVGYIEQTPTQKNHEFYNGVCRITD